MYIPSAFGHLLEAVRAVIVDKGYINDEQILEVLEYAGQAEELYRQMVRKITGRTDPEVIRDKSPPRSESSDSDSSSEPTTTRKGHRTPSLSRVHVVTGGMTIANNVQGASGQASNWSSYKSRV